MRGAGRREQNSRCLHGSILPSLNCLGGGCDGGVASAVSQIREKGTATPRRAAAGYAAVGTGKHGCGLLKRLRHKIDVQYPKLNASSPTPTSQW
ncbi:unnamed protein product [Urochloa humidicola]